MIDSEKSDIKRMLDKSKSKDMLDRKESDENKWLEKKKKEKKSLLG